MITALAQAKIQQTAAETTGEAVPSALAHAVACLDNIITAVEDQAKEIELLKGHNHPPQVLVLNDRTKDFIRAARKFFDHAQTAGAVGNVIGAFEALAQEDANARPRTGHMQPVPGILTPPGAPSRTHGERCNGRAPCIAGSSCDYLWCSGHNAWERPKTFCAPAPAPNRTTTLADAVRAVLREAGAFGVQLPAHGVAGITNKTINNLRTALAHHEDRE